MKSTEPHQKQRRLLGHPSGSLAPNLIVGYADQALAIVLLE